MAANTILTAIGIGGAIAVVGFFITSGKGSKLLKAVSDIFSKKQQEKIDEIEKHQKTVAINIKEKEKLAEDSKKKIIEIRKRATKEIMDVLKEERIEDIQKEMDEDWDDI
jgi:gas vesicle protein